MNQLVQKLPWYRESAFKSWLKGVFTDFAIAVGAVIGILQTNDPEAHKWWWAPLAIAFGNSVKAFLQSGWDIFFGGPDVYQPVEPPPIIEGKGPNAVAAVSGATTDHSPTS